VSVRRSLVAIVPPLAALALASCAVGPNYAEPRMDVPPAYTEANSSAPVELSAWWNRFNDPQLTRLIERALAANLDIEMAAARVREARALERAAGAGTMPQVGAETSVTRQRISENAIPAPPGGGGGGGPGGGGFGLPGQEFTTWRAGFDASWELDLFGRTQRGIEAARARTGAAVWNRRDSEVLIAGEVARRYFNLRTARERYRNAESESARALRLERLAGARAAGGLANAEELRRLQAERSVAAAAVPTIRAEIDAETHALGVLVGAGPAAFTSGLDLPPTTAPEAIDIPPGLPSDLLRRRPDIRAAERQLAAATADTGVAVADLYPRISLTAAPALVSTALTSLLDWGSRSFSAAAAIDWPLFDGGRRRANVAAANARQEQALINYRKAVLTALQDVEDSLSRIEGDRGRLQQLEGGLIGARAVEHLADTRYRGGLVTFADVLTAQGRRLSLEEQVIKTKGALARDTVALVKALGGGWQEQAQ
jgi:multidrug efflux system outer membrane protein